VIVGKVEGGFFDAFDLRVSFGIEGMSFLGYLLVLLGLGDQVAGRKVASCEHGGDNCSLRGCFSLLVGFCTLSFLRALNFLRHSTVS